MELTNTIITPCAEASWIVPDGIIHIKYTKNADLEGVKQHMSMVLDHFNPQREAMLGIADIRNVRFNIPKEAREYLKSESITKCKKALGIVVKSGIPKILGNLFLKFNPPPHPTKLFTNEGKALEWLKSIK